MKRNIKPPLEWEPMAKNLRYTGWNKQRKFVSGFIRPVQEMRKRGEVEIKFVIKNHKHPDPRNHYQWRIKQAELI